LTKILTLTFYLDLDFQSPASYDHDPHIAIRAKNQGQMSVQKVRLETKGQTDTTDCNTFAANAVDNYGKAGTM